MELNVAKTLMVPRWFLFITAFVAATVGARKVQVFPNVSTNC